MAAEGNRTDSRYEGVKKKPGDGKIARDQSAGKNEA